MQAFLVLVVSCLWFFGGCKRTVDQQRLAKSYYALALAELGEPGSPLEQHKRSLLLLDNALACDPKPHYKALQATLLFKIGLAPKSIALFKELLAEQIPEVLRAEVLNNYACVLAATNQQQDALAIWRTLETNPAYLTPEVAFVNQGKVYVQQEEHERAFICFQKAYQLCPSYVDAYFYAAIAARALGNEEQAASLLRIVLGQEAEHQPARHLLTVLQQAPIARML